MKRTASLFALVITGCSSGADDTTTLNESLAPTGSAALAITLPNAARDVGGFSVTIHPGGSDCSGEAVEALEMQLNLEGLPAGLPEGAAASRLFADRLVVLPAGAYLACAQPLISAGVPSQQCALAQQSFTVEDGATVDVLLISQCEADPIGASAVSAALNSAPEVLALTVAPSRFIATCEPATLAAEAGDPDGDEVAYTWSVVDAPEGATPQLTGAGASVVFEGEAPGEYTVAVSVTDALGGESSVSVPLVVSSTDDQCGCPAGTQDNDDDGTCAPDCASLECADTCDDSTGTAICLETKAVFVTSTATLGGFGGVFGGDAICQTRANAAGLSGTFMAWLSDPGASPAGRFTQSTVPYVMVDGTQIAESWTDLTDGTLEHAIDRTELNTLYAGSVWTATQPNGTFVGSVSCNGWTALGANVTGINGSAASTINTWTQAGGTFCNNAFPLYCFEQ
jgi:hypothetical protein